MTQSLNAFFKDFQDLIYSDNCVICSSAVGVSDNSIYNRCFNKLEPTWLENWKDKLAFSDGLNEVYYAWFTTIAIISKCAKVLKSNGSEYVTDVSCCTQF